MFGTIGDGSQLSKICPKLSLNNLNEIGLQLGQFRIRLGQFGTELGQLRTVPNCPRLSMFMIKRRNYNDYFSRFLGYSLGSNKVDTYNIRFIMYSSLFFIR